MVSLSALWLPIIISAALVYVASFLHWMVLPFHRKDWQALPNEAGTADVLRAQNLPPGQYGIPHHTDMKDMSTPEFKQKMEAGPVVWMTVAPAGQPPMGKFMFLTFFTYLLISIVLAFIAHCAIPAGAPANTIFCVIGGAALLAYTTAAIPNAIWFARPRRTVLIDIFDGVVFALITAAIFVWLWPTP